MGKGKKKGNPSEHKSRIEKPHVEKGGQESVMDEELLAGVAEDPQDVNLFDRVDDLEAEIGDVESDVVLADPREGGGFFSVVRELEEEIDATLTLKDSLESDLETAREKLSQESTARAELETRVKLLESQAALAEQLRQELTFVEEERDRASSALTDTRSELDSATDERNSLTETMAAAEAQNRRLETEKTDLEMHVSGLNEKIGELELLASELDKVDRERNVLEEKVKDLRRSLETSDSMVDTLKSDLNTSRDLVRDLRSQVEDDRSQIDDFKESLSTNNTDLAHARTELDGQMGISKRLSDQVKSLTRKYRIAFGELETGKKALRSLQKTTLRVRKRTGRRKA